MGWQDRLAMADPHPRDDAALPIAQFATWARVRRVTLPYPLDISSVPGLREAPPSVPALDRLAEGCAAPRVALLYVRDRADGPLTRAVAVADTGSSAVVVHCDDVEVGVRSIGETDLVRSVAELLPEVAPLTGAGFQTDGASWDRLMAVADSGTKPERVLDAFADAEVPAPLTRAIAHTAGSRITTGVLGVLTWPAQSGDGAGQARLGAHAAAWYEYEAGGVLVDRRETGRGAAVIVEPYRREAATRLLSGLIAESLRRASPGT
jgi:hypothetical protein